MQSIQRKVETEEVLEESAGKAAEERRRIRRIEGGDPVKRANKAGYR